MLEDKDLVSIQEVRAKVEKAYAAWQNYRHFSQEQVDAIVERMAAAARAHSPRLAELAVEETGYGNAKDKLAKNLLCADLLPRRIRGMKTVGVLRELPEEKVTEIGVPVGVVAAILPTTNPTSTAIYKALMRHDRTGVILSTGGHAIVKAAYSSGKPAFGVGPGNVPVMIERTADIADAISKIVDGKAFDFGTVCSSEQAVVAEEPLRDRVIAELKARKAYFCSDAQKDALGKLLLTPNWTVNPKCVGQPAPKIAA